MKYGFTGTRHGQTEAQKRVVDRAFGALDELHHGDCVGADADAHEIAAAVGADIVIHPPVDEKLRAFCKGARESREPRTHFQRNRNIVDETDHLIGTPYEMTEQPRGGTWYTIGYARKLGKPCSVILPDGTVVGDPLPHQR